MSQTWSAVGLGLWFTVVFFTSRPLYHLYLRYGVPWWAHRWGLSPEGLAFSFDRMVYVVPVPNHDPLVLKATPADVAVEVQVIGRLFPQLQGARVMLRTPDGAGRPLAFMALAQMSSPMLDEAQLEGRIDARTYGLICASHLVQPATLRAMCDEVLLQLRHSGRYV
jgi:hypothetical protein